MGIIKEITSAVERDLPTLTLLSRLVSRWSQSAVNTHSWERQTDSWTHQPFESQTVPGSVKMTPTTLILMGDKSCFVFGVSCRHVSYGRREKSRVEISFSQKMSTGLWRESLFWLLLINSPMLIPEDGASFTASSLLTSPSLGALEERGAEIKNSSPAVRTLSLWLFMPLTLSHFKQARQRKQSLAFQPADSFICVYPKTLFFLLLLWLPQPELPAVI